MEIEQAELLAQVAHLYFEKGNDQSAIARRLRVSRSSVSRLLTQARKSGVVEIRIHYPLATVPEMAQQLRERFGLKEALVLRAGRGEAYDAKTQIARLAARYLETHIAPNDILAISRGTTLHAVVEHFTPAPVRNVSVVQLVGALRVSHSAQDDANLARALAQKMGGEYYNLTAPLFVENVETRRALMQESSIVQVLALARQAKLALVGIGSLERQSSSIVRQKLLAPAQVATLRKGRAVGEICSQYFNIEGKIVSTELSERTIGLELADLSKLPRVLGVATGAHKAKAILGALRGGYVGVIITDDHTAKLVLELDRPRTRLEK
ncbi:MAG: sugar-binding transcriptional regulator [Chloroflexi bacterium]|nr:sugar-binding transcriptional regulator [Chloroflexota bacterium]